MDSRIVDVIPELQLQKALEETGNVGGQSVSDKGVPYLHMSTTRDCTLPA
jgi:hypothetical protein